MSDPDPPWYTNQKILVVVDRGRKLGVDQWRSFKDEQWAVWICFPQKMNLRPYMALYGYSTRGRAGRYARRIAHELNCAETDVVYCG